MREALMVIFIVIGIALFVAGDVIWVIARQRNRPIELRLTGTLIAAGVVLMIVATAIRPG